MLKVTQYYISSSMLLLCITILSIGCTQKNSSTATLSTTTTSKKALIQQDQTQSFDNNIMLTKTEINAQQKLTLLKQQFTQGIALHAPNFHKQPFHTIKSIIDTSSLYQFIQNMPKGGLLHTHSGGLTNAKWIIKEAQKISNCYVYCDQDSDQFLYGELRIYDKGNAPNGFTSLSQKLQQHPEFEKELYALLTLKGNTNSSEDVWKAFEKRFMRINTLISYRPFFNAYYKKGIVDLLADQVTHLEIRFVFSHLYDDTTVSYPIETAIEDLQKIVLELQQSHPNFSLRLIYTSLKFLDIPIINTKLIEAFELKKKYPDFITGFDLVAEEDRGNTISFYAESWKNLDSLETIYGFKLPLVLHAGESNSTKNVNLYDAILLKSKRIGHGLNLVYFPSLIEKVKAQDILIEVNPISNQILKYVSDIRNHPARILLKEGIQLSISNDDPGVFGYEEVSYDFFMAYLAWELDLKALKKLVYNSITYSTLEGEQRTKAIQALDNSWETFIKKITASN